MKGASLADLHLGKRQFAAMIDGRNAREIDVEKAWIEAVTQIIEYGPDLVTIAGDIFEHPRVSSFAVREYLWGVERLLTEAGAHVIVLQGNHDAGRTADVLSPIELAGVLKPTWGSLHIVTEPERITFDRSGETCSVACFPFVTRSTDETLYELRPDPDADVNILCMHAAVKGAAEGDTLPHFYGGDHALDVGRQAELWDVIACGDYHEFTRLHPERMAFYSGSLERTSSNIWQETAEKGWVAWDTETGEMELREVETRSMRSTEDVSRTAEGLNLDLQHYLDSADDLPGSIRRLVVKDFPREEREHIDWSLVNRLKESCLHFYLDIRYSQTETEDLGDRRETPQTLADEANAFFSEDPEDVRETALGYMGIEADTEEVVG